MWVNNLLFNGNEETSTEMILIDFQISQWTSPIVDLCYMIFTSCQTQVIVDEFDQLVEFYYKELARAMEVLQCKTKIPSQSEFLEHLDEKSAIVCMYVMETLALCKADTSLNLDLESLTDDSEEAIEQRRLLFTTPEYLEALRQLLPFMDKRGYFDKL